MVSKGARSRGCGENCKEMAPAVVDLPYAAAYPVPGVLLRGAKPEPADYHPHPHPPSGPALLTQLATATGASFCTYSVALRITTQVSYIS